jgi:hypothetical protein
MPSRWEKAPGPLAPTGRLARFDFPPDALLLASVTPHAFRKAPCPSNFNISNSKPSPIEIYHPSIRTKARIPSDRFAPPSSDCNARIFLARITFQVTLLDSSLESSAPQLQELAPVDSGFQCWRFLAVAFLVEMVVWGLPFSVGVLHLEWVRQFKGQGGEALLTLSASLQVSRFSRLSL